MSVHVSKYAPMAGMAIKERPCPRCQVGRLHDHHNENWGSWLRCGQCGLEIRSPQRFRIPEVRS